MRNIDFQGFVAMDKDAVSDFTVDGKCSRCGECCKDILPIDYVELARIKKYVKANHIVQQDHHLLPNTVDMTCPFLNIDGPERKCVIYPVRPQICKKFICSAGQEKINELVQTRTNAGTLMSLRKEVFGDDYALRLAALSATKIMERKG